MDWILPAGVLAAFGAAGVSPWVCRGWGRAAGVALGLVPLVLFAAYAWLLPNTPGEAARWAHDWAPSLGVRLSFYADGLSRLFLLVITAIGTFIVWYASGYLQGDPRLGRFYCYLFGFMGAMLGLVSADNLVLLFVFWELTSITSYLLIGYSCEAESSRRAALQALLVTGGGGLAMLAGILLLGLHAGTLEISELLARPRGELAGLAAFPWIFGLLLAGAFTKSAQFPFHFWLPNAMEAPAPVSAFLHSATMVKAGVFLLARLHPCLAPSPWWSAVVAPVGAATMLVGVWLALGQRDLKKILAYTTVAVLGILTLLLGLGTPLAVKACMTFLLAHALYKAALFMASGTVDHETGSRDANALGGLAAKMPWTAAAAMLAALSMAGLPFFLGFVSKEYFYKALLEAPGVPGLWEALGVAASAGLVALAGVAGLKPFLGMPLPTPKSAHEGPWVMWLGPLLLGLASLKLGFFPGAAADALISTAAAGVLGDGGFRAELKLWHGFSTALGLSVLTLALGILAYFTAAPRLRAPATIYAALAQAGPERTYFALLEGMQGFARWQTRLLQNGYLRNYLLTVGLFTALLLAPMLLRGLLQGVLWDLSRFAPLSPLGVAACVLAAGGAGLACMARSRFAGIMSLGVVGLAVAVLFYLFSAPDLAMTQILVETLALVLLVLAFRNLPLLKEYSRPATRLRDALLACAFGLLMATLVFATLHFRDPQPPISQFMGENSLPLAKGRNVVNVILVDFRALDTLGEITVLGIAALGVLAMLRLRAADCSDKKGRA